VILNITVNSGWCELNCGHWDIWNHDFAAHILSHSLMITLNYVIFLNYY
jgi:hypothetical protein